MSKQQTLRSERQLLDALDRIGIEASGLACLYIKFSELKLGNRQVNNVRIFRRLMDDIVSACSAELFVLSNKDFAIIGKGAFHNEFAGVIKTLKNMLRHDPFIVENGDSEFAKIYDFPEDYYRLYDVVNDLYENSGSNITKDTLLNSLKKIDAEDLDSIINKLSLVGVEEFVRKQNAIKVGANTKDMEVVFQEFFTSMKELSNSLSPDIDILSDGWLFQHLTQTLDKRMLNAFTNVKDFVKPPQLNLNLNVSSVFSKEFVAFAKKFLISGQKIAVEFQLMDVFYNLNLFYEARELLWKGGHKVLLDAVDMATLDFLDISKLKTDYVKLIWNPNVISDKYNKSVEEMIERIGAERVILIRCETEKSLKWGLKRGISVFQGYYIDTMIGAMTKMSCPLGNKCTIDECSIRKKYLAGGARNECYSIQNLDSLSILKTGAK